MPLDFPPAPRAPSIPELTHETVDVTIEAAAGTFGSGRAASEGGEQGQRASSILSKVTAELPLYKRRFYGGASYLFLFGDAAGQAVPSSIVSGNAEIFARGVWASPYGLSMGGGLGFVVPIASTAPGSPEAAVASTATGLRAWDAPLFAQGSIALRPSVDVRALEGGFVLQFRQGLDFIFDTSGGLRLLAGSAFLYAGYQATDFLAAGLEVCEYYVISGAQSDLSRASFYFAPTLSWTRGIVQPSLSVYQTFGTPLDPTVSGGLGLRLGVTLVADPQERARR